MNSTVLIETADSLDQLVAEHESKRLGTVECENIGLQLLGEAIENGAFREAHWRLFREALVENPHIGTAIEWIRSHAAAVSVTVPSPTNERFDWVVDGLPLVAQLVRGHAPLKELPATSEMPGTSPTSVAGDSEYVLPVQVVFADVVKYSLRKTRLQKEVISAFTDVCGKALASLGRGGPSEAGPILLPTGDGIAVGFVQSDRYDLHLTFALRLWQSA